MKNHRNLSSHLLIVFSLVLFPLGCSEDQAEKGSAALSEVSTPTSPPRPHGDYPEGELPEENQVKLKTYKYKKQDGVLREKGDFWIGLPHEKDSWVYLRLEKDTEIKVLRLVEGFYEVEHREMVGFVEMGIVDMLEATTTESTASSDGSSSAGADAPVVRPVKNEDNSPPPGVTLCTGAIGEVLFPGVSCVQYRSKVQEKVSTLENYITRILDKSEMNRKKSIDLACRLFVNEEARVYTSNVDESARSRPVRKYLNSLMTLNYEKVEIDWTNIQYVSELRKGPDGKYFGYVHIEQKFEGFIDGRLVYGDITEKKITVILEAYEVIDARGDTSTRWDVFLSDIGVEQTQNI